MRRTLTAVLLLLLTLTGCAVAPAAAGSDKRMPAHVLESPPEFTVAAVGDSFTSWTVWRGIPNYPSWTKALPASVGFEGEGWAQGYATLAQMARNVHSVDADVLVVMGGTNDLWDTPVADRLASIDVIVTDAQAPRVLLAAVPPVVGQGPLVTAWDATLSSFAATRGWTFVDPWVDVRAPGDEWIDPSFTVDGIHLTQAAADLAAARIAEAATRLFEGR